MEDDLKIPKIPKMPVVGSLSLCLNKPDGQSLTHSGVNVQYAVRFSCFWTMSKFPNNFACFAHFLHTW